MNKYNPITVKSKYGQDLDRSKVVFRHTPNKDGFYRDSMGRLYQQDKNGTVRRVKRGK